MAPLIDDDLVETVIAREFPNEKKKATAILSEYGGESWQKEVARVRLAILYLAKGDIDELRNVTNSACTDYRDVLSWAEYPNYDAGDDARNADRARYNSWIEASHA